MLPVVHSRLHNTGIATPIAQGIAQRSLGEHIAGMQRIKVQPREVLAPYHTGKDGFALSPLRALESGYDCILHLCIFLRWHDTRLLTPVYIDVDVDRAP